MNWSRWLSLGFAAGLLVMLPARAGVTAQVRRAVSFGYAQQYDSARSILTRVPDEGRFGPLVGFWRAALLQTLLYDSGNPALADSFHQASDRALAACRARLKTHPRDADAHLFYGLTQLNRANCLGWERRRLRALLTLVSASSPLTRATELDSTLADAWFGLATVEYFRSVADRYALGLGLLGSRERAYKLMARARSGKGWLGFAATFTLAWMHKEDGNYEPAIALCRQVLEEYPDNRTGLRLLRDSHLAAGDWRSAIAVSRQITASINRSFPDNRYGRAENDLVMLKAWKGMGRTDSARVYADRLIARSRYEQEVPWLASYIAEARQLRRELGP